MDEMKNWTNWNEDDEEENAGGSSVNHEINMAAKQFCRKCEDNQVPAFVSYYLPKKGYKYRAVFPEEIGTPEVKQQYGKFKQFLKVCIDFNKEDYTPHIH